MLELPENAGPVGAAIVLGKPVVDTAVDLVQRMLGKPCDLIGEALVDEIQYWRWSNRVRIFHLASEKIKTRGTDVGPVPPSFLFPLIEAAAIIDDSTLQDLFAELIANGNKDTTARQPLVLETLKRLSAEDAVTIKIIRDDAESQSLNYSRIDHPNEATTASIARLVALGLVETVTKPADEFGEDGEVLSDADNLRGPITIDPAGKTAVITQFGRQFLGAVGLPVSAADPHWYTDDGTWLI